MLLFEVWLTFRTALTDCLLFHCTTRYSFKVKGKQLKAKAAFFLTLKASGVLRGRIFFFFFFVPITIRVDKQPDKWKIQ